MSNPYRAMCAELVDLLDCFSSTFNFSIEIAVVTRARALLALPVAEGPSDDKLMDIARATDLVYYMVEGCGFASPYMEGTDITAEVLAYARAALARWGHPTPQPEGGDIHYAWELHDAEGEWQAGGSAITLESVRREGNHYLQTYLQDNPHTLIIYQASTIEVVTND